MLSGTAREAVLAASFGAENVVAHFGVKSPDLPWGESEACDGALCATVEPTWLVRTESFVVGDKLTLWGPPAPHRSRCAAAAHLPIRAGMLQAGCGILRELLAADPGYRGQRVDCGNGHDAVFVAYRDKVIDTALGPVTLRRARYHCARCRHGLAPRDAEPGVTGASMSPGLAAMTSKAAAAVPFASAARLLEDLAGRKLVPLPPSPVRPSSASASSNPACTGPSTAQTPSSPCAAPRASEQREATCGNHHNQTPDTSRLTSPHPKMIFIPYKSDAHPGYLRTLRIVGGRD